MRKKFFEFFEKRGHTKVPSSPLIPAQDPTLLFTNAGMNQFKDIFLGKEARSYKRAVTIQKCMRAGGKHSDLDNVGLTNRHLTFFEMMGNFSFGDYFKKDAIQFAWDFLTQEMQFDPQRMYATVFIEDNESYDIWEKTIKLPKDRIYRLGEFDNFWQMGDTGPCGPCTEIYIDRGAPFGCSKASCAPGCSCDRFLEVWNLVFMQYDRQVDGSDVPLKQKGVDTGMGLERLCVIMQNKVSVFETDLFAPLLDEIKKVTGIDYYTASKEQQTACNVMSDHARSSTFLIAEGVIPSNEGRGYVLRKIIRRAALFMQKVTDKNILPDIAQAVINTMSPIYPHLKDAQESIKHLLKVEVDKFAQNLIQGQIKVREFIETSKNKIISGKQAFKLYDTFGFPLELTKVIAHEHGFTVDTKEFDKEMELQRERSGGKLTREQISITDIPSSMETIFTGYQEIITPSEIVGLILDNKLVNEVPAQTTCWIITKKSPFYVEKGGQVSDEGWLVINDTRIPVKDLQRLEHAIAVQVTTPIPLKIGASIISEVDKQNRLDIMNNHTATHLLQSALIEILGKEVKQSGSLVHPDYLRFDFTYHKTMTPEQIKEAEDRVNEKIRENIPVNIYETSYEDALSKGVIAIFGEKYNPEKVRVIDIKDFSKELCGGTHVSATGDIGCFKITQEVALSAGQRRVFAVTGRKAIDLFQQNFDSVKAIAQAFKVQPHEVVDAVEKQQEDLKHAFNSTKKLKKQLWHYQLDSWLKEIEQEKGIPFAVLNIEDLQSDELREVAQMLLHKKPGLHCVLSSTDSKISFVCMVSSEFKKQLPSLKELANIFSQEFDLKGGGKDDAIQGGGPKVDPKKIKDRIADWIKQH